MQKLQPQALMPETVVFHRGTVGDTMFFIVNGQVAVLADDGSEVFSLCLPLSLSPSLSSPALSPLSPFPPPPLFIAPLLPIPPLSPGTSLRGAQPKDGCVWRGLGVAKHV